MRLSAEQCSEILEEASRKDILALSLLYADTLVAINTQIEVAKSIGDTNRVFRLKGARQQAIAIHNALGEWIAANKKKCNTPPPDAPMPTGRKWLLEVARQAQVIITNSQRNPGGQSFSVSAADFNALASLMDNEIAHDLTKGMGKHNG